MALLGLTRLAKKDIFTETIWNDLMDILEAKFSGGVSESDLTWPLVARGNIDFGQQYSIVGLRSFWNVVLCDPINGYTTLDAAVSAVEATGGGAVFIPPYTTISANNVSVDSSNVTIFGAGPTSVLKITAASTNPILTTAAGITDFRLMNLALDGTGGGSGCQGVRARQVTRFQMHNVYMHDFSGDFVYLTNNGVAGNACVDAYIQNLHCSGGSDNHLVADDVSGLELHGFVSKSATGDVISMVPAGASNLIQDVLIAGARISGGGAKGIRIIGSGAAGIDAHSRIHLKGCRVRSMTGLPFELGNTSALLKDVTMEDCFSPGSTSDGIRVATNRGTISNCHVPAATTDGIDITNSVDLWVVGNHCQDAGAYGINADTTTDCTLVSNNCRDAVTDGVNRASATNLRAMENVGDEGATVANVFADFTSITISGTSTGQFGSGHTLDTGTLKTGDVLEVIGLIDTGAGATGTVQLRVGTSVIKSLTFAASTTYSFKGLIRVNTAGNSDTEIEIITEGASTELDFGSPAITWTGDPAINFNVSAHGGSGNISLARFYVALGGSK